MTVTLLPEVGPSLAELYLRATTTLSNKAEMPTESWWVAHGEPLALVEYSGCQAGMLPSGARSLPVAESSGLKLDFAEIVVNHKPVGVWFFRVSVGKVDLDLMRRLRINLFRLHSEIESLKYVAQSISRPNFPLNATTAEFQHLKRYLVNGKQLLQKKSRFGLDQDPIIDAVQRYKDLVANGQRPTLIALIEEAEDRLNSAHILGSTTGSGEEPHVDQTKHLKVATPVLMAGMILSGITSIAAIAGGIYAIYKSSEASTQINIWGATISTESVGVALAFIGLVCLVFVIRAAFKRTAISINKGNNRQE
jgi:hypothetical protein